MVRILDHEETGGRVRLWNPGHCKSRTGIYHIAELVNKIECRT
jgi:hypothetical protein